MISLMSYEERIKYVQRQLKKNEEKFNKQLDKLCSVPVKKSENIEYIIQNYKTINFPDLSKSEKSYLIKYDKHIYNHIYNKHYYVKVDRNLNDDEILKIEKIMSEFFDDKKNFKYTRDDFEFIEIKYIRNNYFNIYRYIMEVNSKKKELKT